ncbi:cupin domain-containing protein [Mangrovitalea sediminis]|uniref:cupin domain-containing protein n=1 Tax=Mangrovitalea sediminis TaxID=1982043 RepID=UPI000BE51921|nr:cupin domain-containing protein [Mangrovitalea sediminis]
MQLNADFTQRAVIRPDDYQWVPSPAKGVERMMLDRVGDEVARATSLVRYLPQSAFPAHTHGGGEEFLVLAGEFADEHGRYPAGTYVRNPIGTRHAPRIGKDGAQILVKLCQFSPEDQVPVVRDTHRGQWLPGRAPGVSVQPLHQHGAERVALVRWAPNTRFDAHCHWGGEEIFVLNGTFHDEHGAYPRGSWLRSPHLSQHRPYTLDDGALLFVKTGHLTG